ncbi:AzlD domain-containing protein [Sulfuritalea sp.]|uniref:AzlD domain-containing protein n=1 Tax=Sulfuritalea sp. TaxID=2480090 RepID=UPI001AD12D80|nr:AzlD domain-containing protein [Sulfuritalea sp.]MBN8474727.1 AzlD domain-containing protein [Sulfuritalea sp.]
MTLWGLMLLSGALTFAIRYSFIAAEGHYLPPDRFPRLLPFVPVAALTALTAPELMLVGGAVELGTGNSRLWAGVVAIAVAAIGRSTLLTIASGFLALFLLQRI